MLKNFTILKKQTKRNKTKQTNLKKKLMGSLDSQVTKVEWNKLSFLRNQWPLRDYRYTFLL